MTSKVKCPICKKKVSWANNPYRPFCSERCKNRDLGNWANGTYAIGSEEGAHQSEEEVQEKEEI